MYKYLVVYEFYRKTHDGGTTGCRFPHGFNSREEFLIHDANRPRITRPIARGVTPERSEDLLALTPEVCQLTYSVEKIDTFVNDSTLHLLRIDNELKIARLNITSRRERRQERNLIPKPGFPFVDSKPHIGYPVRQDIFRLIKNYLMTPDGTLADLDGALASLRSYIIHTYKINGINIHE